MTPEEAEKEGLLSVKTLPLAESIACFVAAALLLSVGVVCFVLWRRRKTFVLKHMALLGCTISLSQFTWAAKNLNFYLVSDERGKIDFEYYQNVISTYELGWWFYYLSLTYYLYFVWHRTQHFLTFSRKITHRIMTVVWYTALPIILLPPLLITLRVALPRDLVYGSVYGSLGFQRILEFASATLVLANLYLLIFTFSSNIFITRCILNHAIQINSFTGTNDERIRIGKRLILFLCLSAFFTSLGILALFFSLDLSDPDVFYTTPFMFVRKGLDNLSISWYTTSEVLFQVNVAKVVPRFRADATTTLETSRSRKKEPPLRPSPHVVVHRSSPMDMDN